MANRWISPRRPSLAPAHVEEPPAHGPLDTAAAADDGAATAPGEVDTSRREPTEGGGPSEALGPAAAATEAVDSAPAQPSANEPAPSESQADDSPQAQPVVEEPVLGEAPAVDAGGPLEEESPLDDLTWDAIAVALATEPPIPPGPEPAVDETAPTCGPEATATPTTCRRPSPSRTGPCPRNGRTWPGLRTRRSTTTSRSAL